MTHYLGLALALISMALAGCGTLEVAVYHTPTPGPVLGGPIDPQSARSTMEPDDLPLHSGSDSEDIRLKLLQSHTHWRTIWIDAVAYPGGDRDISGGSTEERHQLWIDQTTYSFRTLSGPAAGPASLFRVSDGQSVWELNLVTGNLLSFALPPSVREPFKPPTSISDSILPHPLDTQLGSGFSSLVLPAGLAQRAGGFDVVGVQSQAGRESLVVDWRRPDGARPNRYWIDVWTGVILRSLDYGKEPSETVEIELVMEQVLYDQEFPAELFDPSPASFPSFSDAQGNPFPPSGDPLQPRTPDPLGSVYFFSFEIRPDAVPRLMRVPGSCATAEATCPPAEILPTPFRAPIQVEAGFWAWSPDGKLAAFSHRPTEADSSAELFIFDPTGGDWTPVADFPFLDGLTWSADGTWIAFRAQDGGGSFSVYAVRSDGSDLVLLHHLDPAAARSLHIAGWLGREVIFTTLSRAGAENLLAYDIVTGRERMLFALDSAKTNIAPSPDGSLLALAGTDAGTGTASLELITPDGHSVRELTLAGGRSIHPVVWSPDGRRLAFYVGGLAAGSPGEVYLLDVEGGDGQQVFKAEAVASLAFSPDTRYLLVEGGADQRLYVINLSSLEPRLLRAPGLSFDTGWRLATWQPQPQD